jgi:iron complex outermembrane recepter protein
MSKSRRWLMASSAIIAMMTAAPALAQEPAAAAANAAEETSTLIEEVVVTAEKRAQSVQDIPVAVSAFTDKTRENIGIQNVQDLTNFTPGMQYTTGNDRVTLRGISRFTNNRSSEGGVAIYVDGTYTSSTTPGNLSTTFIERTEVLRGPQGTLYGRNSVGGAVNFITRRPKREFGGEVRGTVQNYNYYAIEGQATGPITDHIRWRAAGSWSDQAKGYFKDIDSKYSEGGRGTQGVVEGQLAGDLFGEKLEWWVKAQFVNWQGYGRGPGGRNGYTTGVFETSPLVPTGQVFNSLFGFTGTRPANTDHFAIDVDDPNYIALNYHQYVGELVYHAKAFDVKYLGAYNYYDYNLHTDVDGTSRRTSFRAPGIPIDLFPRKTADYHEEPWWYSNEINITSTGEGPLKWILGAYGFREGSNYKGIDAKMPDQAQLATPSFKISPTFAVTPGAAPNPERSYATFISDNVTWSEAVFAQGTYKFSDQWALTLGARYTWDRRKSFESARVLCYLGSLCGPGGFFGALTGAVVDISQVAASGALGDPAIVTPTYYDAATGYSHRGLKDHWSALTGTANIDYTPDEDTLIYAKYTRGYKAGGFNAGSITANPSTRPEFINAYEIGLKKTIGARLQANTSAFWYDYTDVQVPLSEINPNTGGSITNFYNLPKATSKGFEVETIWFPTDRLQVLANYAYLDAKIDEACCFSDPEDPTALQPGANPQAGTLPNARGQSLAGEQFPNATPHRVTLNGSYSWDLFGGSLTGSGSYIWRSATYTSQFNRFYNKVPAWGQVDLRGIWRRGDVTVIGYVKNLLDEEGPVGASGSRSNTAPGSPTTQPYDILSRNFTINQPRTIGLEVQRRF